MTNTEFVNVIATETELPKTIVAKVLKAVTPALEDVVKARDSIRFAGFKIEGVEVPAREGVTALTGKAWQSPAHTGVKVKALGSFKAAVRE